MQMIDSVRKLSWRRIASLAGHIEMRVVPVQRNVGGNHDGYRGGSDKRAGRPGWHARAAATQRKADREHEQSQQRQRPGYKQETVRNSVGKAGETERSESECGCDEHGNSNVGSAEAWHVSPSLPSRERPHG